MNGPSLIGFPVICCGEVPFWRRLLQPWFAVCVLANKDHTLDGDERWRLRSTLSTLGVTRYGMAPAVT